MKKNWIFIILSIAMLFLLGFAPAPGNEQVNTSLSKPTGIVNMTLSITNKSPHMAYVTIQGTKPYFQNSFYVPKGGKIARSINVFPGNYRVLVGFGVPGCNSVVKGIQITKTTKKINLSFECGKFR